MQVGRRGSEADGHHSRLAGQEAYVKLSVAGEGSFGTVWLGIHRHAPLALVAGRHVWSRSSIELIMQPAGLFLLMPPQEPVVQGAVI